MSKIYIWALPALLAMITLGLIIAVADAALAPNLGASLLLGLSALLSLMMTTASMFIAQMIVDRQNYQNHQRQHDEDDQAEVEPELESVFDFWQKDLPSAEQVEADHHRIPYNWAQDGL